MKEKSECYVAFIKVKNSIITGEVYYDIMQAAEFNHYPSDEELFEVWDSQIGNHDKLIYVKVEKQVRFD
jgi:hypothetical protein